MEFVHIDSEAFNKLKKQLDNIEREIRKLRDPVQVVSSEYFSASCRIKKPFVLVDGDQIHSPTELQLQLILQVKKNSRHNPGSEALLKR